MNGYYLRLLDPVVDLDLYREAYSWRAEPRRRVLPDRMSFADFTAPDGIAVGLFNGDLQAVFFLHEIEPRDFQCHFSARRKVLRETLLAGAAQVACDFFAAGAEQLHAWVTPRSPLRRFLTDLGFARDASKEFTCQNDTEGSTLPSNGGNQPREFVKYVLRASPVGFKRPQTNINAERPDGEYVWLADPA